MSVVKSVVVVQVSKCVNITSSFSIFESSCLFFSLASFSGSFILKFVYFGLSLCVYECVHFVNVYV